MKNKTVVNRWGQFFAELHNLSRNFEKDNSEVAKRIQRWDQIHHSILAGTKLHPDDEKVLENPEHYGVLHGDLNCSNFFYEKTT
jgi:Ser/Thr protein kinase RdoA (MazF antagonist)